ncbi:hypothetical protein BUMB_04019 [Candidatus Paraburkholderia calva]|nr:hypothetical protein BUMB_04019 [Candidatus Paraburkholderia calva]
MTAQQGAIAAVHQGVGLGEQAHDLPAQRRAFPVDGARRRAASRSSIWTAISGASLLRPGMQELIGDGLRRRFDLILTESLDRLSHGQETSPVSTSGCASSASPSSPSRKGR